LRITSGLNEVLQFSNLPAADRFVKVIEVPSKARSAIVRSKVDQVVATAEPLAVRHVLDPLFGYRVAVVRLCARNDA
jgi:hypothetical protein